MKKVTLDELFKRFLCVCAEELPIPEPGDLLLYKQRSKYNIDSLGTYTGFLLSYAMHCVIDRKKMQRFEDIGLQINTIGLEWEYENKFILMNLKTGKVEVYVD